MTDGHPPRGPPDAALRRASPRRRRRPRPGMPWAGAHHTGPREVDVLGWNPGPGDGTG